MASDEHSPLDLVRAAEGYRVTRVGSPGGLQVEKWLQHPPAKELNLGR